MITEITRLVASGTLSRECAITLLRSHATAVQEAIESLEGATSAAHGLQGATEQSKATPILMSEEIIKPKKKSWVRVIASSFEDASQQLSEEALISAELVRPKRRPEKAGETCAFEASFNLYVWQYYPGKHLCQKAPAIKAASELTLLDYRDFLANYPRWVRHWQKIAFEGKEQYIHRLHNFITYRKWVELTPGEKYALGTSNIPPGRRYAGPTGELVPHPGDLPPRHIISASDAKYGVLTNIEDLDADQINEQLGALLQELKKDLD